MNKVKSVSKYVISAVKNLEFAPKLHAVLLESGASPPPDLFLDIASDIGSKQKLLEQAQPEIGGNVELRTSCNSNNYWSNHELLIMHYVLNQKNEGLGLAAIKANSGSLHESPGAAIIPGIANASKANTSETDGGASYQKISEEYSLSTIFDSSNERVGYSENLSRMKGLLSVQGMKESFVGSWLPPRVRLLPTVFTPDFYAINANPATVLSLLWRIPQGAGKRSKSESSSGGLLRIFKLFPLLTTGCKVVTLLSGRHRKSFIADHATIGTVFGYRRGRVTLAIQEDPHRMPVFVMELPITVAAFYEEMASDVLRIALESESKTQKKKVTEEFVWAVYCNGRKMGYSIRRRQTSEDEAHVMQLLRGVSMGAGILPCPKDEKESADGELTYLRARFEKVVGSKDSEALYMINPDSSEGPELSIFFLRVH
ncbi:hypothetical protein Nepgr_018522 [Nepenthes gracilis]|uniref:Protein MIZU-KUSSEI 1-like n=1 Tax=Nepenthes gracilis TaxID=150966 RepID=A0AAD3XUE3_NEPGR|nr:hypothetical protein Nepgr_018522 [Nepenthes gracilis]